uniref:collagen-like protein n=1 Tax=Oculatella sp. LEGE 06141 TaxID=1828648 RepID=UPI0018826F98|nr:collagen-like protein [Oculatella sp. LEGE 06141]
GQSISIVADGSPSTLNLAGETGAAGEDGDDGYRAQCGSQPRDVNYNLRAANGGNGGNGGDGGGGGDGGTLTVYYLDPEHLRSLAVQAAAGQGGRAGRGGYGGYGCTCQRHRWEQQVCSGTPGTPGYRCTAQRFTCSDGRDGQRGRDGRAGEAGNQGQLALVNQREPLAPDQPRLSATLMELSDRPFNLSKNRWNRRQGATALLAPGSVIADQYQEFAGRIEGQFQLVWNAAQPFGEFARETATLELNDDQQIAIAFPDAVWVEGNPTQQEGLTTFAIANVMRESEATQLSVADLSGRGTDLTFAIVDLAGKSDLVATEFRLRYRAAGDRSRNRANYRTRFDGAIPATAVIQDYNRFNLALGQLPIDTQFLAPGTRVELELVATRSFAGRTATQSIRWQGEIRASR